MTKDKIKNNKILYKIHRQNSPQNANIKPPKHCQGKFHKKIPLIQSPTQYYAEKCITTTEKCKDQKNLHKEFCNFFIEK